MTKSATTYRTSARWMTSTAASSRKLFTSFADRAAITTGLITLAVAIVYAIAAPLLVWWGSPTHPARNLPVVAALPAAGSWGFAESPFRIESTQVSSDELNRRLTHFDKNSPEHLESKTMAVDATPFVRLAQSFGISPTKKNSVDVYAVDNAEYCVRLIVDSRIKTPQVLSAFFASRLEDDAWQLQRLTPQTVDSTKPSHLLPLPDAAQTSATRKNDSGELVMEFVQLNANSSKNLLLTKWQAAGWTVERTTDKQNQPTTGFSYLCVSRRPSRLCLVAISHQRLPTFVENH